MFSELKKIISRSSGTLLQDAAGLSAVVFMLLGALFLPGFA
ncbi:MULTISPECIES: hypothetical protein [Falsihalocynthiibacter]|nr:hypothetical protein [Falsihalocynthiibacter arcticus]